MDKLTTFSMIEQQEKIIALHEAGHALVCCWLAHTNTCISYPEVSLERQGEDFGYTHWSLYQYGDEGARAKVMLAYGGFVAVSIAYGEERVCLGTKEDFESITNLGFSVDENLFMKAKVLVAIKTHIDALIELYEKILEKKYLSKMETREIWLRNL